MNARPSDDRIGAGLLRAGTLASFLSVVLMFGSLALFYGSSLPTVEQVVGLLIWLLLGTLVGLPIAWLTMFAIGIPLWRYAARNGPITQMHAAKLGVVAGAIVGAIETLFAIASGGSIVRGELADIAKHVFDVACTIRIGAIWGLVAKW
mgnify:CR=1 FL=1